MAKQRPLHAGVSCGCEPRLSAAGRGRITPPGVKVNTMLKEMTRSRVIQSWFVALTLVAVASIALGASVTLSTGAILLALSVVPPTIVLMLWPGPQPATAADV